MPQNTYRRPVGSRPCVEGHTVLVTDRGGSNRIMEIKDISEVRWSRLRDQKSSATITVTGSACRRQADALGMIEPRRHEIVIYRGQDRVWEGPIRYVKQGRNQVTINAFDVLDYIAARPITRYWPGPDRGGPATMTARVQQILETELTTPYVAPGTSTTIPAWESLDPPIDVRPYLDVRHGPLLTRAEVLPFEMSTMEHLTNLARGGLDFTTVGRRIIVWDSAQPLGVTRTMTEADISGDPAIYADGDGLVTVQHVIGQPAENAPAESTDNVGSYVRDMSYYGPWANIHTRSDEDGSSESMQAALNTQARNLSAGGVPVPVDIVIGSQSSLRLDHTLGINDLVAGVEIPLVARLMGREIARTQRLSSISVSETAEGESITGSIGNPGSEAE